jgi:hypothetical protein
MAAVEGSFISRYGWNRFVRKTVLKPWKSSYDLTGGFNEAAYGAVKAI